MFGIAACDTVPTLSDKTVAKAAEVSAGVVESKKSNGLDGDGEIPHPAGKAKGPRAMAGGCQLGA